MVEHSPKIVTSEEKATITRQFKTLKQGFYSLHKTDAVEKQEGWGQGQ